MIEFESELAIHFYLFDSLEQLFCIMRLLNTEASLFCLWHLHIYSRVPPEHFLLNPDLLINRQYKAQVDL